jgi:hypothetical protein
MNLGAKRGGCCLSGEYLCGEDEVEGAGAVLDRDLRGERDKQRCWRQREPPAHSKLAHDRGTLGRGGAGGDLIEADVGEEHADEKTHGHRPGRGGEWV